jgi:1,4-alpha-glucan branching enzyme
MIQNSITTTNKEMTMKPTLKKNSARNTRPPAEKRWDTGDPIVEFKIRLPKATAVSVAGTFNGWDPQRTPLRREDGGVWRIFLPLNTGRYEYRFVVDGQWLEDPGATEFAPNPFGGRNAVVTVAGAPRPAPRTAVAA